MKLIRPQVIWESVFRQTYWVYYNVSQKEFEYSLNKHLTTPHMVSEQTDGETIICTDKTGNTVIVIWTDSRRVSDLSHELIHAVEKTLRL